MAGSLIQHARKSREELNTPLNAATVALARYSTPMHVTFIVYFLLMNYKAKAVFACGLLDHCTPDGMCGASLYFLGYPCLLCFFDLFTCYFTNV